MDFTSRIYNKDNYNSIQGKRSVSLSKPIQILGAFFDFYLSNDSQNDRDSKAEG